MHRIEKAVRMQSFNDLKELIDDILHTKYYGWEDGDSSIPNFVKKGRIQTGMLDVREPAVSAVFDDLDREIAAVTKRFRRRYNNRMPGERWECPACNRSNHLNKRSCECGWSLEVKRT